MSTRIAETPILMQNVSVLFGDHAALDELDLSFRRSIVTAVIGASGSGKSLALKAAAGLIFPEQGEVLFEGRSIVSMGEEEYRTMQARTGFHFQDAALWANKSLRDNLTLPLLAGDAALTEKELDERVETALSSVGLHVNPQDRPASISMGQRKMLSFLRATITGPELLFLDEPTSFMDAGSIRRLVNRIEEAREAGVTIIMATHNRTLGERLADEVVVLEDGRLAARGGYGEIMTTEDPDLQSVLRHLT